MNKDNKETKSFKLKKDFDTPYLHFLLSKLEYIKNGMQLVRMKLMRGLDSFQEAMDAEAKLSEYNKLGKDKITDEIKSDIEAKDAIIESYYVDLSTAVVMDESWMKLSDSYNRALLMGDKPLYKEIILCSYDITESEIDSLSINKAKSMVDNVFLVLAET